MPDARLRPRIGLLGKFALASLLPLVLLGFVLAHILRGEIRQRALANARQSATLLDQSLVQPQLSPEDLAVGLSEPRIRALDRTLRASLAGKQIARIKIWNRNLRVVYSSDHAIIGRAYPASDELQKALGGETASEVSSEIARVTIKLAEYPTTLNIQAALLSILVTLVLAVMQALIYMVVGYAFVGQAVCLLLGPLFVPFFIVPKLDWLFWGWAKAALAFSMMPAVANAFIYVFGKLLLAFLFRAPDNPEAFLAQFSALFPMFLVFIYGLLKIPALTNDIFSGSTSGDSAFTRTVSGALGLR